MAALEGMIGETWRARNGPLSGIIACSTLAVAKASASVGLSLLDVLGTEKLEHMPAKEGLFTETRRAYGSVLGVPVGLALAVATLLIVVPFLVWLVIFIGLPN